MAVRELPKSAAWLHTGARDGFEVVFPRWDCGGLRFEGSTAAVESSEAWVVNYVIALATGWFTRSAVVSGQSASGSHDLRLEADGTGGWRVNGIEAPHLDGCLDVDLESSSLTNAFPVHRLGLDVGESAEAPAAYVRAADLSVERLEQRYLRMDNDRNCELYHYTAPGFEFECELRYDVAGLVVEYPGIATRVG
jgi:uncharacterized protein